jgi:hypothetical protein
MKRYAALLLLVTIPLLAMAQTPKAAPPKAEGEPMTDLKDGHATFGNVGPYVHEGGMYVLPRAVCYYEPRPDITTHELALLTPVLIRGRVDAKQWAALDTARRHLRLVKVNPVDWWSPRQAEAER